MCLHFSETIYQYVFRVCVGIHALNIPIFFFFYTLNKAAHAQTQGRSVPHVNTMRMHET